MKQEQSSTTAEGMALVRAIETKRPAEKRICYDPIARSLVSGFAYAMSKLFIDLGLYARLAPGTIEYITVRERYIDDFFKMCLWNGLDQVVILGAGFDTRAYRIPGIEKMKVFEVDHPTTQDVKLSRLKKIMNPLPKHVTFVPVDFDTQTLEKRLIPNGYEEKSRTLFIWQGVTMYLTMEGVDNTLAFIANHSGPGSAVIFDYFYNEALLDMKMNNTNRILKAMGERLMFGIDKGRVESFLAERGFHDVHNADVEELTRLYLIGPNVGRRLSEGVNIASAWVNHV